MSSGLFSQLGAAKEATYGTRVAPTQFFEYTSESVQLAYNRLSSRGLRAGRTFQQSNRVATTTRGGSGTVNLEVVSKGFGFWLDLLHGNTVTPAQQGGSTAYLQTHNIGTGTAPKSATVQVGKPGEAGTVHPFDYLGSMVTGYTFSCAVDEFLSASFDLDVRDRQTNQTLATATYPSGLESFHFAQAAVTFNGSSITDTFESFTLSGSLPRNTDRYRLGSGQTKLRPILNDYTAAQVTLGGVFKDLTNLGLYDSGAIVPVVVTFTSTVAISGSYYPQIRFTMPACQVRGEDPTVGGPDVLGQDVTLEVLDNGTDAPVKIEYTSTDSAAL